MKIKRKENKNPIKDAIIKGCTVATQPLFGRDSAIVVCCRKGLSIESVSTILVSLSVIRNGDSL